jgi:hypothetical protein
MNHRIICIFAPLLFSSIKSFSQTEDLYRKITQLDSAFFHAYNTCDIEKQADFFSDNIEFYHDKTGLETSKQKILESTKKYICNKVTRELVPGSLEVSPLPGYGAVELGIHRFRNNAEKDAISKPSKFMIIWKNNDGNWKITRVISLH